MFKRRHIYTQDEEEEMRKIVKKLYGNPANVSYWERVIRIYKNFANFSADSLRCHWRLMNDKSNTKQSARINWKNQREEPCTDADSVVSVPEEPRQIIKNVQKISPLNPPKKLLSPNSSKKKEKIKASQKKMNSHVDENRFQELFEDLVDLCAIIKGKKVSEIEVLKVLIEQQGLVSETINFYKKQKNLIKNF